MIQVSNSRFWAVGVVVLNISRNSSAASRAMSYPSVMIRGWSPSDVYRSACLSSSPQSRTVDVVPSPVTSSYMMHKFVCLLGLN